MGQSEVAKGLDGEYLFAWSTVKSCSPGWQASIWAQVYERNGMPRGQPTKIYPTEECVDTWQDGRIWSLYIVSDNAGNYIIGWTASYMKVGGEEGTETVFRKVDRHGSLLSSEFTMDEGILDTLVLAQRSFISLEGVAMGPNGGVIFITRSACTTVVNCQGFYVWNLDERLRLVKPPFATNAEVNNWIGYDILAADGQGNIVVTWKFSYQEVIGHVIQDRILAQRFSMEGEKLGEQIAVHVPPSGFSQYGESSPKVAMDSAGNFVVVWWWKRAGMFVGQRFNAGGERIGRIFQINVSGQGDTGWSP